MCKLTKEIQESVLGKMIKFFSSWVLLGFHLGYCKRKHIKPVA